MRYGAFTLTDSGISNSDIKYIISFSKYRQAISIVYRINIRYNIIQINVAINLTKDCSLQFVAKNASI